MKPSFGTELLVAEGLNLAQQCAEAHALGDMWLEPAIEPFVTCIDAVTTSAFGAATMRAALAAAA